MFCTSAKPRMDWELRKMLKESGYDCATLIANPSEFAKELGAAFAAYSRWSDVSLSSRDEVLRQLLPPEVADKVVWVYHGPVVYQRNPTEMIEAFPEDERAAVVPFVKREEFSHQREYRFTVLIRGEPKISEEAKVEIRNTMQQFSSDCQMMLVWFAAILGSQSAMRSHLHNLAEKNEPFTINT